MSSNIVLSASMQQNLLSLQQTQTSMNTTQYDLSTGYKVNSAIDNPTAYFAATAERNRANDLSQLKDSMGEAVQTVSQAQNGITAITGLIQQMQSVVQSAGSATTAQRDTLQTEYNTLRTQLNQAVKDANYQGVNLLGKQNLTVVFDENNTASLTISGFSAYAGTRSSFTSTTITGGLGIVSAGSSGTNSWGQASFTNILSTHASQLSAALTTLRTQSENLASNLSVVTIRQQYTSNEINTLNGGADNLTLADPNQEGANMLALQTRQQLGLEALSLSSQAQQGVLRLFGA
jgi:flagellin-like hook-associated protein FlgL